MSFIEEIKGCFEEWELPKEPIFRAVVFGESAVYFENVCSLRSYQQAEIVFNLKKGGVRVTGESLYLKKYCMGDVLVCGKIVAIERV
jgi:sporulation protein YqfC